MLPIRSCSVSILSSCVASAGTLYLANFWRENCNFSRRKVNSVKLSPLAAVQNAHEAGWSMLQRNNSVWEDPDAGSDSESEWEKIPGNIEENDLDYESDWDVDSDGPVMPVQKRSLISTSAEEQFEIEQLLSPEEKAIFRRNPLPNLGKISSPKWKPLHTLAMSGQIAFLDKLLDEEDLTIDAIDKDGQTPLHKAIMGNKEAAINHLVRKRANLDARDQDGATPLHYAVHLGSIETVKLLIKYRADVNIADNEGWTPLHVSVQRRNRDIIKILLLNGADKTMRNRDGRTPLDICLCYGRDFNSYDIAKLLKLVPADENKQVQ